MSVRDPIWLALLVVVFLVAVFSGGVDLGAMIFILIWGGVLYVVGRHMWGWFNDHR